MRRRLALDPVQRAAGLLEHLDDAAARSRGARDLQAAARRDHHEFLPAREHRTPVGARLHDIVDAKRNALAQRLHRTGPLQLRRPAHFGDAPGGRLRDRGRRIGPQGNEEEDQAEPGHVSLSAGDKPPRPRLAHHPFAPREGVWRMRR